MNSGFFEDVFSLPTITRSNHVPRQEDEVTSLPSTLSTRLAADGTLPVVEGTGRDQSSLHPAELDTLHLDVYSTDLAMFLYMLNIGRYAHASSWLSQLLLPNIQQILRLADMFDSASVKKLTIRYLENYAPSDPWGVLRIASDQDDISSAKVAIRCLTKRHIVAVGTSIGASGRSGRTRQKRSAGSHSLGDELTGLQPLWRLELLGLLMTTEFIPSDNGVACVLDLRTGVIAQSFNPDR